MIRNIYSLEFKIRFLWSIILYGLRLSKGYIAWSKFLCYVYEPQRKIVQDYWPWKKQEVIVWRRRV